MILELEPKRSGPLDLRAHTWGIIRGRQKLLVDPDGNVARFDLTGDPDERAPHTGGNAALAEALTRARAELARGARAGSRVELDEETREALRELGYAP